MRNSPTVSQLFRCTCRSEPRQRAIENPPFWHKKRLPKPSGSPTGGEYEIRTREAVTPTRFPSVRHRPLGEFSNYATSHSVYPRNATRLGYNSFFQTPNRRVATSQIAHSLEESVRVRTSPRTEFSTLWDNSPANAPLSVPDRPLTGGISPLPRLSQSEFLQWLEQSVRP